MLPGMFNPAAERPPGLYVAHQSFVDTGNRNNYIFDATLDATASQIMLGIAAVLDTDNNNSPAEVMATSINGQSTLEYASVSEYTGFFGGDGDGFGIGMSWVAGPVNNPQLSSGRPVGSTCATGMGTFVSVTNVSEVVDTDSTASRSGGYLSRSVNTEPGGIIIAAYGASTTATVTWGSNMTEFMTLSQDGMLFSIAYMEYTPGGQVQVEATGSGGELDALVMASFR